MTLLADGRIEIEGRMPWSSNGTYLCTVTAPEAEARPGPAVAPDPGSPGGSGAAGGPGAGSLVDPGAAGGSTSGSLVDSGAAGGPGAGDGPASGSLTAIYKPLRTERPLWDFPDGLYRREVAAYELAVALGWDMVPQTVERLDGPLGLGSLQRFVDADFEQHYFTLLEDDVNHPQLQRMAVFDVLANNADRKGGHCLVDAEGHIWGIDHGLCFHTSHKLRTVIWDWAGDDIDGSLVADVARFAAEPLSAGLRHLLTDDEQEALVHRARALVGRPRFPEPRNDHPYPWPLV